MGLQRDVSTLSSTDYPEGNNRMTQLHVADEDVEEFVRGALLDPHLASVEEHLLICEGCRHSVDELDQFVADLRAAVDGLERLHLTTRVGRVLGSRH